MELGVQTESRGDSVCAGSFLALFKPCLLWRGLVLLESEACGLLPQWLFD